jgi:hypothetical protein
MTLGPTRPAYSDTPKSVFPFAFLERCAPAFEDSAYLFSGSLTSGALLSHLGGPQPQRYLGVGRILFATVEEIGQGFALEQAQLDQAQDGLDAHGRT